MNSPKTETETDRVDRIKSEIITDDDRAWYITQRVELAEIIAASGMRRVDTGTRSFPSPMAYARAQERRELNDLTPAVLDQRVTWLAETIANQQV